MVQKIPVPDSTATALSDRTREGETRANVIDRLLKETSGVVDDTEQLAQNAMNVSELQAAHSEGMSNEEYLAHAYGIDVDEYESVDELRAAKTEGSR